ncbi:MAG: hypothetical protein IJW09_06405 [Clostridia bacterium]|nr:hypothetical protein [Clostridia bacterium]
MKKTMFVFTLLLVFLLIFTACQPTPSIPDIPDEPSEPEIPHHSSLEYVLKIAPNWQTLALSEQDQTTICDILNSLPWEAGGVCECMPLYRLKSGETYVYIKDGHVEDTRNELRATLTDEQYQIIGQILQNAMPDVSSLELSYYDPEMRMDLACFLSEDRISALLDIINNGTWSMQLPSDSSGDFDDVCYTFKTDMLGTLTYSPQTGVLADTWKGAYLALSEEQKKAVDDIMLCSSLRFLYCGSKDDEEILPISLKGVQEIFAILQDESLIWDKFSGNFEGDYIVETERTTYYLRDLDGMFDVTDEANSRSAFLTKEQSDVIYRILWEAFDNLD